MKGEHDDLAIDTNGRRQLPADEHARQIILSHHSGAYSYSPDVFLPYQIYWHKIKLYIFLDKHREISQDII